VAVAIVQVPIAEYARGTLWADAEMPDFEDVVAVPRAGRRSCPFAGIRRGIRGNATSVAPTNARRCVSRLRGAFGAVRVFSPSAETGVRMSAHLTPVWPLRNADPKRELIFRVFYRHCMILA